MSTYLSIDPGTRNLGLSFWRVENKKATLLTSNNIDVVQKSNATAEEICFRFHDLNLKMFCPHNPDFVIIEKQFCSRTCHQNYLNYLIGMMCMHNYPYTKLDFCSTSVTDSAMKLFHKDIYDLYRKDRKKMIDAYIAVYRMLNVNCSQHEKDSIYQACMYFLLNGINIS